jgi:hypothetical protein
MSLLETSRHSCPSSATKKDQATPRGLILDSHSFIKHQPEEARRRRDAIEFATHDKKSPPKKTPKKSSEVRPFPLAGDEKVTVDEPGDVVGVKKFDFA